MRTLNPLSVIGAFLVALCLGALPAGVDRGAAAAPAQEVHAPSRLPENPSAVWVVRDLLLSPADIRSMVDHAQRAGITDLFIQVRGRGDAYYESDLVPVASPLRSAWKRHGRYDPLQMTLDLAHERGIRVHAWMNVYLVSSGAAPPSGHVVWEHPEWVAADRGGHSMTEMTPRRLEVEKTEGMYLEPGNGEVVAHFLDVVTELLARYPVDGIHLDYVRYPMLDVGYTEAMRAGFRRRTGVDPLELEGNERGLRRVHGDAGFEALYLEWKNFKAAQVSALVAQVSRLCRHTRPELILSAAVKPDAVAARLEVGQDWVRWVEEGWVDVVAPMMYSKSETVVRRQAESLARLVPPERVWAGIAVYNQSLAAAEGKIRACRRAGLSGISIFSYNSLPGGGKSLERLNRAR